MARFIKLLQLIVVIIIGFFIIRDMILHGLEMFNEQWAIIAVVLTLLLELALFVIYKLIEED